MKLIILDRDGVINYERVDYIKSPDEWVPIPGSLEAISQLCEAGYTVAVITNQSGIHRGYYTHEILANIHEKMINACKAVGGEIKKIVYCPHLPQENCECRKPKTGMLEEVARYFSCSLEGVPFVGDRMSDVHTALKAKATPILVNSGHLHDRENVPDTIQTYENLAQAVNALLQT